MTNNILKHKIDRSSASHAILDSESRKKKADKILRILNQYSDLSKANVLDIGTGSGDIAHELGKSAKSVTSVDITDERRIKSGYKFVLAKDETLPFTDKSFDVVVSNHIVEHVPNQAKHFSEIQRVLKSDGVIYLATPNKWWLKDPHYKLPFVSWLPRDMSDKYVKRFHGKDSVWDIYPLSHNNIKSYIGGKELVNILPQLVKSSYARDLDTWDTRSRLLSILPTFILEQTKYASPTLIYIIKK